MFEAQRNWAADWIVRHRAVEEVLTAPASLAFRRLAPPRRFVIVSVGRAGTELLVDLLVSHPEVRSGGEVLNRPARRPQRLILGRAALAGRHGIAVWGVKILPYQLEASGIPATDHSAFLQWACARGFDVIHVRRANPVAQALSQLHADLTQYHFRAGSSHAYERHSPAPREVERVARYFMQEAETLAGAVATVPHLAFVYEDDLVSDDAQRRTHERLCDHFGLPWHDPATDLVRITPSRVADRVGNYDELVEAFHGTPLERYLDL